MKMIKFKVPNYPKITRSRRQMYPNRSKHTQKRPIVHENGKVQSPKLLGPNVKCAQNYPKTSKRTQIGPNVHENGKVLTSLKSSKSKLTQNLLSPNVKCTQIYQNRSKHTQKRPIVHENGKVQSPKIPKNY